MKDKLKSAIEQANAVRKSVDDGDVSKLSGAAIMLLALGFSRRQITRILGGKSNATSSERL